ncbi:hypothetical protein HaLaN_20573 [Haematococcus lacustris]|uniref:Uncharacterized protein n=1 Tax=Haematococcus lacustris TaxID=44745 RepID=A0A699ZLV9_HAELA|nr:hypothetical protein HaLaN_20573 [Haematococcus lacustris]
MAGILATSTPISSTNPICRRMPGDVQAYHTDSDDACTANNCKFCSLVLCSLTHVGRLPTLPELGFLSPSPAANGPLAGLRGGETEGLQQLAHWTWQGAARLCGGADQPLAGTGVLVPSPGGRNLSCCWQAASLMWGRGWGGALCRPTAISQSVSAAGSKAVSHMIAWLLHVPPPCHRAADVMCGS